jgi:hypothetical protein
MGKRDLPSDSFGTACGWGQMRVIPKSSLRIPHSALRNGKNPFRSSERVYWVVPKFGTGRLVAVALTTTPTTTGTATTIAAAESAAAAAAGAAAVSTAAATAGTATEAAAATTATGAAGAAFIAGASFVDAEGTTRDLGVVQGADGRAAAFVFHFHKAEALGTLRFAVNDDLRGVYLSIGLEEGFEFFVRHAVGQIAHVDVHRRLVLLPGINRKSVTSPDANVKRKWPIRRSGCKQPATEWIRP